MDWLNKLDIKLQVVIISSLTSFIIFVFSWIFRMIYERGYLSHKLKKEFEFEQKKKLKEEIAKNKIPLLNAVEELNHRLWNFSQNIGDNWHKVSEKEWCEPSKYYIKSFVYRFLVFLCLVIKTEKDTISVDTTIADSSDILFLKYIKTFKDIFTDADLLKDLDYDKSCDTNHFFKNDLIGYSKFVYVDNQIIDFDEFILKFTTDYSSLLKVIEYFANIQDDDTDKNLNVLRCTHLLLINFLNKFGHSYQKTDKRKINNITKFYKSKIKIKTGFLEFIKKSKLENEMQSMIKKI